MEGNTTLTKKATLRTKLDLLQTKKNALINKPGKKSEEQLFEELLSINVQIEELNNEIDSLLYQEWLETEKRFKP